MPQTPPRSSAGRGQSGKTPWCAGCNTETSAKYLHVSFPESSYSILRLQRHLGPFSYDAAELNPGMWEMVPRDSTAIASAITKELTAATEHFRRVQRRFSHECLGWHFAVGQDQDGLWVELQVLVWQTNNFTLVLQELTGGTRKAALFQPDTVIRSDYSTESNYARTGLAC